MGLKIIEVEILMNQLISLQTHTQKLLDKEMELFLKPLSNGIRDILSYYYTLGGKKLRPTLFLAVAQAFNAQENLAPHALALELIHTMSLYHDDVIDGAKERRGAPTVHEKWDNATAIVGGDIFHSLIHGHLLEAVNKNRVKNQTLTLKFLRDLIYHVELPIGITVIDEMNLSNSSEIPTIDQAIEIVVGKTAPLFAFSAAAGASIAGQTEKIAEDMFEMGRQLGYAFQLLDDIGDFFVSDKDIGSDLREDKKTPLFVLANQSNPGLLDHYRKKRKNLTEDDIISFRREFKDQFLEILQWVDKALNLAREYIVEIPNNQGKDFIKAIFSLLELKLQEFIQQISQL